MTNRTSEYFLKERAMVSPVSGRSNANYQSPSPAPSPPEDPVWQAKMSAGKDIFSASQSLADQASKDFLKEPEKDEDDPDSQPI
jgi:hypothetical protein